MSKTLIVVALAGAIGVGVFLYVRRARAGDALPMQPSPDPAGIPDYAVTGVPERVAQKRYAGATMANTSSAYDPQLPAGVQAGLDIYKRGSDVVGQGKTAFEAAASGDVGGALATAGAAYNDFFRPPPSSAAAARKPAPAATLNTTNPLRGRAPTMKALAEIAAAPQERTGHNRF